MICYDCVLCLILSVLIQFQSTHWITTVMHVTEDRSRSIFSINLFLTPSSRSEIRRQKPKCVLLCVSSSRRIAAGAYVSSGRYPSHGRQHSCSIIYFGSFHLRQLAHTQRFTSSSSSSIINCLIESTHPPYHSSLLQTTNKPSSSSSWTPTSLAATVKVLLPPKFLFVSETDKMSIDRGSTFSDAHSNYSLWLIHSHLCHCHCLPAWTPLLLLASHHADPCHSIIIITTVSLSQSSPDENIDDSLKIEVTEAFCSTLLRQLNFDSVPQECHTFASFQRTNNHNHNHNNANKSASTKVVAVEEGANPFAGMPAHQQLNAQSARARGRLNQAQIMRRMSSRAKPKERSWF